MSESKRKPESRKIEKEIEIAAPIEAVWKALTDDEELKRWFPLEARVEPGKGGKIFVSWGADCEGTAPIEIWEPNRRFQWVESSTGQPVVVEWSIEKRGG
ncbi:MAG: SRPBCC domain-containing protein [Candidatus Acidiferrales bacterium]